MDEDEAWGEWQPTSSDTTSGRSDTVHYLAKYMLRSSVVLQAVYGRFRSPISYDIVLGKETSIELVAIGEDGILRSVCEQTVFGIIKDIVVLCSTEKSSCIPISQGRDLLAVLSDSGKLSFLTFSTEMDRFCVVTHVEVSPTPGNSRQQLGRMLAADSNGCFLAVSAYEDKLALVSISASDCKDVTEKNYFELPGSKGSLSPVQLPPGTIWSISFVSRDDHLLADGYMPIVAVIMRRNGFGMNELLLFSRYNEGYPLVMFSAYSAPGTLSLSITDVPHISGFALLFRLGDILLMNLSDPSKPLVVQKINLDFLREVEEYVDESSRGLDIDDEGISARALLELREYDPMCIDSTTRPELKLVCSWSWESSESGSPKLLISLDTGDMYMLDVHLDQERVAITSHGPLFNCFPCKNLVWVRGGFVAAFVEMGDGKVLKLENGRFCAITPIQNVAPILDVSLVDCHDEKHDLMYACCGVGSEGSLRIVQSGVHVEKLLSTAPHYAGITGLWALHMKATDCYHSFLVLSFVEETRILSVGPNFSDVSDDVGFKTNTCTLACGLVSDGMLVQIYSTGVRVCLPASSAQVEGIPQSTPIIRSWCPDNMSISRGAVGNNMIVTATSNPCCLTILAVKYVSSFHYEIYKVQHFDMHHEISCISIPDMSSEHEYLSLSVDQIQKGALSNKYKISKIFAVGTHKPSMEILSFTPEEGIKVLAVGAILINSTLGIPLVGCIPEDVRFVFVDRCYLLSGLRNGMILRFELPGALLPTLSRHTQPFSNHFCEVGASVVSASTPVCLPHSAVKKANNMMPLKLELMAIRRIGTTPVFLVPLQNSLDSDIIALCERPWLLQSARHTLAYTSISFEHATHVTPVSSAEFPEGILYASGNRLHLVEMDQSKRLNGKKFHLGGTPRKVLYHKESKTLLVMRVGLISASSSSDICCLDPLSGSVLSRFKFALGEKGKCMQIVKVGDEEVLVVGTSQTTDNAVMPNGESESVKGRLVVLSLQNTHTSDLSALVLCSNSSSSSQNFSPIREVEYAAEQLSSSSHCSSPDDNSFEAVQCDEVQTGQLRLIKAKSFPGVIMCICPYLDRYFLISAGNILCVFGFLNGNPRRLRRFASIRTRFMITCVHAYLTRIVVGDCRDGILYFSYDEAHKKLEQLYCDPKQRLMADCLLLNSDTAVASDRKGSISVLSSVDYIEDNANPERNLVQCCAFYVGETIMTIRKGSFFSYKLSMDDGLRSCIGQTTSTNTFIGSTLLGSVMVFLPIRSEVYKLLKAIQTTLAYHPLTAPILGNDHHEFRQRESIAEVPMMLDGDMLAQFLELTHVQQQSVLSQTTIPVTLTQLVQLLEQIHHALS